MARGCAAMMQGCCEHIPTWPPQINSKLSLCDSAFCSLHLTADTMEDDLMFSMEEEEGSAKRPPVLCSAPSQRASSLSDANASDDDDDDEYFICPILDDSAKEVCNYLTNLVQTRQLSNSLPKSNFMYKVSHSNMTQGA